MKIRYTKILLMFFFMCHVYLVKAIPVKIENIQYIYFKTDTITPEKVIVKFLQWYKVNMNKANSFPILIKDTADNFKINKKACDKYLGFLQSSRCLSPRYIAYWRSFFNDKAIGLESNPDQSDIPDGFDLDFVLITQEPELVLNHISQIKFRKLSIRSADQVISVKWPQKDAMQYQFEMHKSKNGWQIDYISTPNFD